MPQRQRDGEDGAQVIFHQFALLLLSIGHCQHIYAYAFIAEPYALWIVDWTYHMSNLLYS